MNAKGNAPAAATRNATVKRRAPADASADTERSSKRRLLRRVLRTNVYEAHQMKIILSRGEKLGILALYAMVIAVTLFGFVASIAIGKSYPLLAGFVAVAYVFGLRHAVDADHIAAIDNTTRKLINDGKRPFTVGTWFSLGHSTIVVALIIALILATRAVAGSIPELQSIGDILGTAISGIFLWVIGLLNVVIAIELYSVFRKLRAGKLNENQLEGLLDKRGFMSRYLGKLFKAIEKPWQIYPIGVLFGLGFDTASEVALIAISVGLGASSSVPIWMILILPLMFACGMVLIDTSDGVAMTLAYGWAFMKPIRKIYYNLTITVISVGVALIIGTVELLQVLSHELGLSGSFWLWLNALNFETLGFAIIGLFMASWAIAIAIYRLKDFEHSYVAAG